MTCILVGSRGPHWVHVTGEVPGWLRQFFNEYVCVILAHELSVPANAELRGILWISDACVRGLDMRVLVARGRGALPRRA